MTDRVLRTDPQPVVEGWDMHLYCRYTADFDHDYNTHGVMFFGSSRAEARQKAKSRGWMLHRDGTASCPACVRALRLR